MKLAKKSPETARKWGYCEAFCARALYATSQLFAASFSTTHMDAASRVWAPNSAGKDTTRRRQNDRKMPSFGFYSPLGRAILKTKFLTVLRALYYGDVERQICTGAGLGEFGEQIAQNSPEMRVL